VVTQVSCEGLFSDVLHRPFYCANIPLTPYASNIPAENNIPRLDNLTEPEFNSNWTSKPFILTAPVREWPIFKTWNTDTLVEKYADVTFRAEAVDWPLKTYVEYTRDQHDESPTYLFDCSFVEKMGIKVSSGPTEDPEVSYWPPACFGTDLFDVLGEQRPDRRWLIAGPARSGSTFHKDPNGTSAWNAVITGSKYWLMFPFPPPGIYLSADKSEITAPLSIAEYLLTFHEEARRTPGCMEGVCKAGEVLHVPSGWFHLVLNLEEGVAVTQNFVPRGKLPDVMAFLKDKKDQVSGFKDDVQNPYGLFVERLEQKYPELLKEGLEALDKRKKGGKLKWEELVNGSADEKEENAQGGFSFGFGGDEDDLEEDTVE
jgi:hypothetical protein